MSDPRDDDENLARLVEELAGQPVDTSASNVERLAAAHPQHAAELRQLWGVMQLADMVACQSSSEATSPSPTAGRSAVAATRLPLRLGDYELIEQVGQGGMGEVYRAQQLSLDREVAVKLLVGSPRVGADDLARFQVEVEAAAQLDHPNIVPIYDVGCDAGIHYFGMKFIRGETLSARVRGGPLPPREAVALVLTLARAIDYAHRRGVVHRDLKPANVLLDGDSQPHITDFGLAKRMTKEVSLTQTGAILGTPSYMAPELAAGSRGPIGPACDVYSLGAILYALLTGRPPLEGSTAVDTVLKVLDQDPLPPRLLNPQVDRDLDMIVERCLQKPPDLRYPSAAALADDLAAYLSGASIAARSGKLSHVVARLFRETPHATVLENWGLLWMWHAVVLLGICLVTNWFYWQRHDWPQMGQPGPYLLLWGGGLAIWAPIFWALRYRRGPVTAVERQIAHVWGSSIIAVILLFVTEYVLGQPVLTLSPVLGLVAGMIFFIKAGILTGSFYLHSAALFLTALVMAEMQRQGLEYGISLFGLVSAAAFFLPGWKYRRLSGDRRDET